jgi:cytochrome c oxidase assembly protein subunit 15
MQSFKRLLLIGTVLALCVVVLGAYVRLTDAGLGCPDWPGCYGTMTVPESEAAIEQAQKAYPHLTVEVGKAWREMLHRYLAGTLGLVVLAIFGLSWKLRKQQSTSPVLTTTLLLLIIFQALLGMWTVTMLLKPAIVTAHLIGGMSTLALLTWLASRHAYEHKPITPYPNAKWPIRLGLVILLMQILLGGWTSTNYAALACTDFPTCHGAWLPDMDFANAFTIIRDLGVNAVGEAITLDALTAIQWVHRLGALVTVIYMTVLAVQLFKYKPVIKLTIILMSLVVLQVTLGIANLLLHLPLVLAVSHNLVAALLLMVLVVINSKVTE